jgi:hypothetical protein
MIIIASAYNRMGSDPLPCRETFSLVGQIELTLDDDLGEC